MANNPFDDDDDTKLWKSQKVSSYPTVPNARELKCDIFPACPHAILHSPPTPMVIIWKKFSPLLLFLSTSSLPPLLPSSPPLSFSLLIMSQLMLGEKMGSLSFFHIGCPTCYPNYSIPYPNTYGIYPYGTVQSTHKCKMPW